MEKKAAANFARTIYVALTSQYHHKPKEWNLLRFIHFLVYTQAKMFIRERLKINVCIRSFTAIVCGFDFCCERILFAHTQKMCSQCEHNRFGERAWNCDCVIEISMFNGILSVVFDHLWLLWWIDFLCYFDSCCSWALSMMIDCGNFKKVIFLSIRHLNMCIMWLDAKPCAETLKPNRWNAHEINRI